MISRPSASCIHSPDRSPRLVPVLALAGLVLAGCAGTDPGAAVQPQAGSAGGLAPITGAAPAPAAAGDPVAAFAATAVPGTAGSGGQGARMRLLRAYHAASGRECREVLVGTGFEERSSLVCRGEGGAWVQARPLLQSSGGRIP